MGEHYTVGDFKPLTKGDIQEIERDIEMVLPKDYSDFLATYGFGDFNELFIIANPDKMHFRSTFHDCLDLWELEETEKQITLNGIKVAHTVDGDIVLLIANDKLPLVIMPRHSERPIYFETFNEVIAYYKSFYKLDDNRFYFDSHYKLELKCFMDFIRHGIRDKALFDSIYSQFTKEFRFDKHIDNAQPKYVIQDIGGWVYFDTIHKSSIRIKYQKQYKNKADKLIGFIGDKLKGGGSMGEIPRK